jgi:signal transduction histidine kinase
MLVSRRADTDHKDAVPFTLVAVRRSLRVFRRFLLVAAIAFVAVPLAMLAVL